MVLRGERQCLTRIVCGSRPAWPGMRVKTCFTVVYMVSPIISTSGHKLFLERLDVQRTRWDRLQRAAACRSSEVALTVAVLGTHVVDGVSLSE